MGWIVNKLDVDMNTDQVTVGIESNPVQGETILLGFRAPEIESVKKTGPGRAAQSLDDASRKALIAQAKQILTDAGNAL